MAPPDGSLPTSKAPTSKGKASESAAAPAVSEQDRVEIVKRVVRAWESARRVIAGAKAYEIRTTVHPGLLSQPALQRLVRRLEDLGAARYRLQQCMPENSLDPVLRATGPVAELSVMADNIEHQIEDFALRS